MALPSCWLATPRPALAKRSHTSTTLRSGIELSNHASSPRGVSRHDSVRAPLQRPNSRTRTTTNSRPTPQTPERPNTKLGMATSRLSFVHVWCACCVMPRLSFVHVWCACFASSTRVHYKLTAWHAARIATPKLLNAQTPEHAIELCACAVCMLCKLGAQGAK